MVGALTLDGCSADTTLGGGELWECVSPRLVPVTAAAAAAWGSVSEGRRAGTPGVV